MNCPNSMISHFIYRDLQRLHYFDSVLCSHPYSRFEVMVEKHNFDVIHHFWRA